MDYEKSPNAESKHLEEQSTSSNEDAITWTEAEETAIRHKLDWQIVPVSSLCPYLVWHLLTVSVLRS